MYKVEVYSNVLENFGAKMLVESIATKIISKKDVFRKTTVYMIETTEEKAFLLTGRKDVQIQKIG